MRTNIGYIDYLSLEDIETEATSFLVIPATNAFDIVVQILGYYKRDYDILEEPLGIDGDFIQLL